MKENDWTTLAIKKETREKLGELGTADDSLNDVVERLIDFWTRYGELVKEK